MAEKTARQQQTSPPAPLLSVENLCYDFATYGGVVKAARGVSFSLGRGEILGIVGESGCGKSATAQSILKLNPEPPGRFSGGKIIYNGKNLIEYSEQQMRRVRGVEIGFIFQDPMVSLNPTMRVGPQIGEIFAGRQQISRRQRREKALEILTQVGVSDVERRYRQYPHQLSGGLKQRIMIAIALVGEPRLVIADEPTTSLDVTIEAQILELLQDMQQKRHVSIILITHDLGVIAKMCDRVLVMYGGKIVERGNVDEIFYDTAHPYTKGLLASIARFDRDKEQPLEPIAGSPPDLFSPPAGCPFTPRCAQAMHICSEQPPPRFVRSPSHQSSCWLEHAAANRAFAQTDGKQI